MTVNKKTKKGEKRMGIKEFLKGKPKVVTEKPVQLEATASSVLAQIGDIEDPQKTIMLLASQLTNKSEQVAVLKKDLEIKDLEINRYKEKVRAVYNLLGGDTIKLEKKVE